MADSRSSRSTPHEVMFVAYPKLLFVWPLLLAGIVFYPFAAPPTMPVDGAPPAQAAQEAQEAPADENAADAATATETADKEAKLHSAWLEYLGWIYIALVVLVLLTLGVDVDRNQAIVWIVFFGAVAILGVWLRDVKQITIVGDIGRFFDSLDVQYNRGLGLSLSAVLVVPYVVMLLWARINDRWRITHNEFEHYSFGKMDDSLGRGAKTIRTSFPDVFELLLGLAGTLVVYNATGTKELRRIPHVMFLPIIRERLNKILERTAVATGQFEEEEEGDGEDDDL